jgi:class 3 adenylate cyclase
VDPAIPAWQARHVRFCNLSALCAGSFSLIFLFLELPLILDWGVWETGPVLIAIGRALAVLPFALPLWLNSQQRHQAARVTLVIWSIVFVTGLSLLFAHQAPTQLFLLPLLGATLAIFPWEDRRTMWTMVVIGMLGLIGILVLRAYHHPLVPVQREIILTLMDEALTVGSVLLTLIVSFVLRATIERAERHALREHERADRLLLNILPAPIAERLKDEPATIADGIRDATVLFADLVGFTSMSEKMTPDETLALMDEVFSSFDALVEQFDLEKIKTIGDAYMLAGGLPEPTSDHASTVSRMGMAMLAQIESLSQVRGEPLRLRIGMSTGPVVAGVIGRKKFLYDLWGDTVNTASRMESHGVPGQIQVSGATYERLKADWNFEGPRTIEVKGKGTMATWFLVGPKSAES